MPPSVLRVLRTRLQALREEAGRTQPSFQITVGGRVESADDLARFQEAGVTRLVVAPWERSPEAIAGLRRLADRLRL